MESLLRELVDDGRGDGDRSAVEAGVTLYRIASARPGAVTPSLAPLLDVLVPHGRTTAGCDCETSTVPAAARVPAAGAVALVAAAVPSSVCNHVGRTAALLADDRTGVREFAAVALDELAAAEPDALAPVAGQLVTALSDRPPVRASAASALASVAPAAPTRVRPAAERLIDLLESLHDPTRVEAARCLSALVPAAPRAVAPADRALAAVLADGSAFARGELALLVGDALLWRPGLLSRAGRELERRPFDPDPFVRRRALHSLAALARESPDSVSSPRSIATAIESSRDELALSSDAVHAAVRALRSAAGGG